MIWGVAGAVFTAVFLLGGGPESFASESWRVLLSAVVLGLGYVVYFAVIWWTRARGRIVADERDEHVGGRASQVALQVVLFWVFAFGIGLWLGYDSAGALPVGWAWFLAYFTVIVGLVTHSLATLVLDRSLGGDG
jgi:uncharacterized membrane protein